MGFIRLLMLLAIGYFVWLNVKTYLRKQEIRGARAAERSNNEPIPIVKCRQCQLHLPKHEAVAEGADWFCCEEHRRQWLQRSRSR
ncbi:MAG TPA: PP0621 family protein [Candidatus Acidoferrum sp.]|nr:PP0621 family protein [Candidatus Acidoferrum sp.]